MLLTDNEKELDYLVRELVGVIKEYAAMPCPSLQERMEACARRCEASRRRIEEGPSAPA